MLLYSFTGRTIFVCTRNLVKCAKGKGASLRRITAHKGFLGHQLEPASSVQFCTHTPSRPYQSLNPKKASRNMSDDTYASFLDQANQDTGASKASTKSQSAATKAVDTDVPVKLQKVDQYYTSESDEPFEPVSLKWSGKNMPSESMKPQQALSLGPKDVNPR